MHYIIQCKCTHFMSCFLISTGFGVILVMALVVLPVAMIAVGKLVTDNTMLVMESSNVRLVCESS